MSFTRVSKTAVEILLGIDGWESDRSGGARALTSHGDSACLESPDVVYREDSDGRTRGLEESDAIRIVEAFNAIREANGEPPLFAVVGDREKAALLST